METEPIDDERATIEMVSLVAIVDDEPEPKLARGSDAIPPRTDRITQLRRRRESLRVEQIVKKKPTDE